jgi:uncharacterized phage protein gp47/JayE
MPWQTPTLNEVRQQNRDYITAHLHSAAMVPNSVLRVLSDANAGLAFLVLLYIDWLALQLLPDTAETEWLDRQAAIWLPGNGRKPATFASGSVTVTGISGSVLPSGTQLTGNTGAVYQTTEQIVVGLVATPVDVRAIDPGIAGNLEAGSTMNLVTAIAGLDSTASVEVMTGGVDAETDAELRERVLERIQKPPMGGDVDDYVAWAKQLPGVTRAWCASEMGPGTVTVRFMMDDLRADNNGFPLPADCVEVEAYIDTKRPVAVADLFVVSPIPMPVDMQIRNLSPNTIAMVNAIEASCISMFRERAVPGQIFYRAWVDEAISAAGTVHYDLILSDAVPPDRGHLPILGTIIYL